MVTKDTRIHTGMDVELFHPFIYSSVTHTICTSQALCFGSWFCPADIAFRVENNIVPATSDRVPVKKHVFIVEFGIYYSRFDWLID